MYLIIYVIALTLSISRSDYLEVALLLYSKNTYRRILVLRRILHVYFILKGSPFKAGGVVRYFATSI